METTGALLGLLVGVLLAFVGGEALTRGSRALLAPAAGVAAFVAILASAVPEFAFAARAAWLDLPGAAIGAVAGSFVANAFIAAFAAARGAVDEARGGRTFAVASAIAAGALLFVAFDGVISGAEGGLMLLGALVVAFRAARLEASGPEAEPPRPAWPTAAGLLVVGAILAGAGIWLALRQVDIWAAGRADGDLLAGLTMLGAGAALPEIAAAMIAARQGRGARGLVNVAAGTALTLFGAIGAAALVRPLSVPDSFLGLPAATVALAAVVLMAVAAAKRRLSWKFSLAGVAAWIIAMAGFAWSAG